MDLYRARYANGVPSELDFGQSYSHLSLEAGIPSPGDHMQQIDANEAGPGLNLSGPRISSAYPGSNYDENYRFMPQRQENHSFPPGPSRYEFSVGECMGQIAYPLNQYQNFSRHTWMAAHGPSRGQDRPPAPLLHDQGTGPPSLVAPDLNHIPRPMVSHPIDRGQGGRVRKYSEFDAESIPPQINQIHEDMRLIVRLLEPCRSMRAGLHNRTYKHLVGMKNVSDSGLLSTYRLLTVPMSDVATTTSKKT